MDWRRLVKGTKGVSVDSRENLKGKIFVAYKGVSVDGHDFIDQAITKGVMAVVGEKRLKLSVPYFKVKNGRLAWAQLVAAGYSNPEKKLKLIGVTGTDGKTTTCHLIYEILKAAGLKVGLISTVAAYVGNKVLDTGFHVTSPDPDQLWQFLRLAVDKGIEYLVLEVTSHALDQERYGDLNFAVGVVTNITHEHLDYHKTFAKYRQAKAKLVHRSKYTVINKDDPSFAYLKSKSPGQVIPYSKGRSFKDQPFLVGEYNKYNIGAAEAVAKLLGVRSQEIVRAVNSFAGVPGRMEEIKLGQPFRAIVDFAHTPNALEQVLTELRKQLPLDSARGENKLILVFGCAGLRDKLKRPMMGDIAKRLAEVVIITAEDPRTESLDEIYQQITGGIAGFMRQDDRQKAIDIAVGLAEPEDIVVVTGKGHEKSMCFGTVEHPWSDREAVEKAIQKYAP